MIRNFLFHRVNPKRDDLWDPIDVRLFDRCIQFIKKNYRVELLEDLSPFIDTDLKTQYATITFDDGFKDNIDYAVEILDKYRCKASFYIITDSIDSGLPPWPQVLEYKFLNTNIQNINMTFGFLPPDLKVNKIIDRKNRKRYIQNLKPVLKNLSDEEIKLVLDVVNRTYTDVELPKIMMDWNDILELKNAGYYIGSHSVNHYPLSQIRNENTIRFELLESARKIEKKIGHFPVSISYPFGSYNNEVIKLAQEVGYKIGLAVHQKLFNPYDEKIYEISRIMLSNEPWIKTRLRITNKIEKLRKLKSIIKM